MSVVYNRDIAGGADAGGGGGGAETDLSNLTDPTAINRDFTFSKTDPQILFPGMLAIWCQDVNGSQVYVYNGQIDLYSGAAGDGVVASYGSIMQFINSAGDTAPIIQLGDKTNANYVGLKAPETAAGSVEYTLPDTDGTDGQSLKTHGNGILYWG
jgi:hypothetical protein